MAAISSPCMMKLMAETKFSKKIKLSVESVDVFTSMKCVM